MITNFRSNLPSYGTPGINPNAPDPRDRMTIFEKMKQMQQQDRGGGFSPAGPLWERMGTDPAMPAMGNMTFQQKEAPDFALQQVQTTASPEMPQMEPLTKLTAADMPDLPGITAPKKPGIFDRIGAFVGSDQGRAALLRSGAETMRNGLGSGIAAGAAYIDDQKEREQKQNNWVSEIGLRTRDLDIAQQRADTDGLYKAGQLQQAAVEAGIDVAKLNEVIRKNQSGEALDATELAIDQWYKENQIKLGYVEEGGRNVRNVADNEVTKRGQDVTVRGQDVSAATATQGQQYGFIGKALDQVYAETGSTSVTSENEDGTVKTTKTTKAPGAQPSIKVVDGKRYILDPIAGEYRLIP